MPHDVTPLASNLEAQHGAAAIAYDVVLFDLDGTLIEPRAGITASLAAALTSVGVSPPSPAVLSSHIGDPLLDVLHAYGLDDDATGHALTVYRTHFELHGLTDTTVHPGIVDLLETLGGAGARLGVATAKPWPIARRVLAAVGLLDLLDTVAGPELDEADAAKHQVIARALADLGHPPADRVAMVGDRVHDIAGARHHGIDAIGVLWGFGSLGELTGASALHVLRDAAELRAVLLPTA